MPEMMTMAESATRHMAAGVMDLDELARLVEQDTGKVPTYGAMRTYRARFRRHGDGWAVAHRKAHQDSSRRASRRWHAENPAKHLLNNCRNSAKRRGHECTITVEMIEEMLAPMACSVTGLPLTWEHDSASRENPWAPSIDRINGAVGYVRGNVRVVCWAFNRMRSDFPDEVVMTLAEAIVGRRPAT